MIYVLSTHAASVKCKSLMDVIKLWCDVHFKMFNNNLKPYLVQLL